MGLVVHRRTQRQREEGFQCPASGMFIKINVVKGISQRETRNEKERMNVVELPTDPKSRMEVLKGRYSLVSPIQSLVWVCWPSCDMQSLVEVPKETRPLLR